MFVTIAIFLLLFGLGLVLILLPFNRLKELRRTIEALTKRIAALERKSQGSETPGTFEKAAIPPSPLVAAPRGDSSPQVPDEPKLVPPGASIPPPLPPPLPPASPPATPFNWEAFMGVKLFAWLGGLALFLGVVFMVKYSFENNLITPLGRILIGVTVGLALVVTGWWLARGRYRATAQSLCATGIVILYADLFAAHSFYALISLTTAFFAMSAVTLFSFLLAVNLSAQVIVILGLLGGFLTPVLLRSGVDNAPALFLYIALLDLGVAAVALRKRLHYLVLLAAIGTAITQLGWAAQFFDAAKGGRAFWIFLGFEALFVAIYFLGSIRLQRMRSNGQAFKTGTQEKTAESWMASGRRCRRGDGSRILFLDHGHSDARPPVALFLRLHFSGGRRFARLAGNRSGAPRGRTRGRRPDIHSRGGMDWFVCPSCAAQRSVGSDRDFRAPARRDRSRVGLASGRSASHRRWNGDAFLAPDHFARASRALESDARFWRHTHSGRDSARRGDR